MKVTYILKDNVAIHRLIMRLENIEGIKCKDRFVDRKIALEGDDISDRKIMGLLMTLELVDDIEPHWEEQTDE